MVAKRNGKLGRLGVVCVVSVAAALGCARSAEPARAPESATAEADERRAAAEDLLELGLRFAKLGDTLRAEQYLAAALEHGAKPDRALLPLLRTCIKAGRIELATQYAETYRQDVSAQRELEMLLSGLYLTLGRNEDARKHLERVTRNFPSYALAHLLLARLLKDSGLELDKADHHFQRYLELDPGGAHAGEAHESLLKRVSDAPRLPQLSAGEAKESSGMPTTF